MIESTKPEPVCCSECTEFVQGPYVRCETCRAKGRAKAAAHRAANPPARPQGRPRSAIATPNALRLRVLRAKKPKAQPPTLDERAIAALKSLGFCEVWGKSYLALTVEKYKAHEAACRQLGAEPVPFFQVANEVLNAAPMERDSILEPVKPVRQRAECWQSYTVYQSPRHDLL